MENQNLVESVLVGDSEGAFDSFNSIIAEKLADALEVRKVQIASGIMAEEAEQVDEARTRGGPVGSLRMRRAAARRAAKKKPEDSEVKEPNYSTFDWKTKKFKEEVEQIDEMEGPYDSKRVRDAARRFNKAQLAQLSASLTPAQLAQSDALKNKLMGQARSLIDKDTRALKKEEAEQIDERERKNRNWPRGGSMSGDTLDGSAGDQLPLVRSGPRLGMLSRREIRNRVSALRAGGRVGPGPGKKLPEEVEQIDELKRSTIQSYLARVYGSKEDMTARDAKIAARMKASGTRKPNMGPVALGKVDQGPPFMRKKVKVPATNEEVEQVDEGVGVRPRPDHHYVVGRTANPSKYGGNEKVIVAGPYHRIEDADAAAKDLHGHPDYRSFHVKIGRTVRHLPKWDDHMGEEVEQVDEAQLSDAQKLAMMKEPHKAAVLSAMKRYQTVGGDINKLSAGHRTLVTNYLAKSGGLDSASRSAAMAALRSQAAPKTDKM